MFLNTQVHYILFPQIYSNLPIYKLTWNSFIFNIFPRLNYNSNNIMKFFQKFKMEYIQKCTPLEIGTIWHPKGGHHNVFSPNTHIV